jgi:probable F420-dependent oxidoreductase
MRFGLGVPTATEGMMYPVPYASIDDALRLATAAEELGFDSVWGNDHLSTQRYVREEFAEPPRFYDPIAYLGYLAAATDRIRLATAVLVLPFRHPVLVAKQAATLDLLSKGRLVLGVGVGAYREELEATWPGRRLHRGEYVRESLEALAALLTERRSSYQGRWISFDDVESFPKPLQDPLPVLSGGNSAGARLRAATLATGWLPACLAPAELARGVAEVRALAEANGRVLPSGFEVAPQLVVSMGDTHEEAVRRFRGSQVYAHLASLGGSTLKDQAGAMEDRNLIGTPAELREQVAAYAEAGADTLSALLFATGTVEETLDAMQAFAEEVIAPCTAQAAV